MNPQTLKAFRHWRQHGRPASVALEKARADVAAGTARYPNTGTKGWNPLNVDGRSRTRWVESLPAAGLRLVGYADELASIGHTGWYADLYASELYRGAVLQLPAHGRRPRYLAAYSDPNNDGAFLVDVSEIHGGDIWGYDMGRADDDGARDAARAADSFAEREAEKARDYSEAWQRGSEFATQAETITAARREALALLKERRQLLSLAPAAPASCAALVARIRSLVGTIGHAREKRAHLLEVNGWWAGEYGDAFNDGAGETVFPVA